MSLHFQEHLPQKTAKYGQQFKFTTKTHMFS